MKIPVSAKKNIWFDAQQVDDADLTLEQSYSDVISSGIINNHIGNGSLVDTLVDHVLFDSLLASGYLDGVIVNAQSQPSDTNYGNQLEIVLTDSKVCGKKSIKVAIIGLDFENNLQYETFYFKKNESQITQKHFSKILVILFNDAVGDPVVSFNLGGRIVIKEASPLSLSRSPIMLSQDVQPNLFFRDFFVQGYASVTALLTAAMPLYNISSLNITTTANDTKVILSGDVTTQYGQKFKATTNNIQKISFLLSVRNTTVGSETDLAWNGDLIVSVYPLQSNVECSTDIAPNLDIDFAPSNIPLAQISINYSSLQASGFLLNSIAQPIDFVFSDTPMAAGNVLVQGNYYAVTIKRSGSANKCDILFASGLDYVANSRITSFTGSLWVDLPDEDFWFKIWTDAAKVSDGQGYDAGHGVVIPKTYIDPVSLTSADYVLKGLQFTGNQVYKANLSAVTTESVTVQDQRTGQPVLSRQEFTPSVKLLNSIDVTNLQKVSDPIFLGSIVDKNKKFFDSISAGINSKLYSASIVKDEMIIKIVEDPTDTVRFDASVTALSTNLLNGDFVGAKIIPNSTSPSISYRIAESKILSMTYGDTDGDGIITDHDLDLLNSYLGYNLNIGLPATTSTTVTMSTTTFTNGYNTLTVPFVNQSGITFKLVDPVTNNIVDAGTDGILAADPSSPRLANFSSSTVLFNTIVGLSSYKLVLIDPSTDANYGGFDIISLNATTSIITIRKVLLNSEAILQMFRADIDCDFRVTNNDGYLLKSYIDRLVLNPGPLSAFPAPTSSTYDRIGTKFSVLKFRLESFTDRTDDYSSNPSARFTTTHVAPDVFLADGYFASHNFYTSPSNLGFLKQLSWDESLIVTASKPRLVPTVLSSSTSAPTAECMIEGIETSAYDQRQAFEPGKTDYFVPNNLVIGNGDLRKPNGDFYKVDFEVGTVVLEIPEGLDGYEKTINIMDVFVSDYTGFGVTRLGFPAMKFADCTLVTSGALARDQVRFSASVQSFSPNIDGLSIDGYYGAIVDGKIGVAIDYLTGMLSLNFTNLYQDSILKASNTKIQINVFLKKGGFNNPAIFVDSVKVKNLLT